LAIERSAVGDTAAYELRPLQDLNVWNDILRKQRLQFGMMPAGLLARSVTMVAKRVTQPLEVCKQGVAAKGLQITPQGIHAYAARQPGSRFNDLMDRLAMIAREARSRDPALTNSRQKY
jgi:hypothetical protein